MFLEATAARMAKLFSEGVAVSMHAFRGPVGARKVSRAVKGDRCDMKSSVGASGRECVGVVGFKGGCRLANIWRAPGGDWTVGSAMLVSCVVCVVCVVAVVAIVVVVVEVEVADHRE